MALPGGASAFPPAGRPTGPTCVNATCAKTGGEMLYCPGPPGDHCGAAIHVECGGWKRPLSRWVCRECRKERGVLGCGKCRYSVGGCKDCNEEKKQAAAAKAESVAFGEGEGEAGNSRRRRGDGGG